MSTVVVTVIALALVATGALVRWPVLVAVGLGVAAFAYAISLHLFAGAARPLSAVAAGALLLVLGELGFGAVGRAGAGGWVSARRSDAGRRVAVRLGACAVSAAACAVVVLGAASLPLAGSLVATTIGTVAAVLAVWLLVTAVRAGVGDD